MLERFGHDLDARVAKQTSELLAKAAKQFDPDDPTSPMSKHTRELQKQQERSSWNDYLDEAERNRSAAASLGLVREPTQNNGSTVRCLDSRRIVMAFDSATDHPDLLRTVIQLLRVSALTASNREDRDGIHTADEKIAEALGMLGTIDEIKKIAGTLRQHAGKIEQQSDNVRTALARLLSQAQSALSVAAEAAHNAA